MIKKSREQLAWVASIILFVMCMPYFAWKGILMTLNPLILLVLTIICFLERRRLRSKDIFPLLVFTAALLVYTIASDHNLVFFVTYASIILLPFLKNDFSKSLFEKFLLIFTITTALGLVFWFLAIIGLVSPIGSIEPINFLKKYYYLVYPFFITSTEDPLARFEGLYDEPGVMGTLCGLFLIIRGLDFKDWKSIALLLGGCFSLSFFFYVVLIVYFGVKYFFNKNNIKRVSIFAVCISVLIYLIFTNPYLYKNIGYRFEWNKTESRFEGDNRINIDVVSFYWQGMDTRQILMGINNKDAYKDSVQGSSSIYNVIILYGILFVILYFVFFILYSIRNSDSRLKAILSVLVIFGSLYQRPGVMDLPYVFLFCLISNSKMIDTLAEKRFAKKGAEPLNK